MSDIGADCEQIAQEIKSARANATTDEDALTVLARAEAAFEKCADNWALRSQLAWAIWDARIKRAPGLVRAGDLADTVIRIRDVQPGARYGAASCYVRAVTDTLERLSSLEPLPHDDVVERILEGFETRQLESQRGKFQGRIQPSQAERFYNSATRCLARFDKLRAKQIEMCREALSSNVFEDPQESRWISYRLAKAMESDDPQGALAILESLPIQARGSEMSILYVRLLRTAGRATDAFRVAAEAARALGAKDLVFSVGLLVDLAELSDSESLRGDLVRLIRAIRADKGWQPDPRVDAIASSIGQVEVTDLTDTDRAKLLNAIRLALI